MTIDLNRFYPNHTLLMSSKRPERPVYPELIWGTCTMKQNSTLREGLLLFYVPMYDLGVHIIKNTCYLGSSVSRRKVILWPNL